MNEPNLNLRYIYFLIYLIDGVTPALDEEGGIPEINIDNTGWQNIDISYLEAVGYGNYRAFLADNAVSKAGSIILSHFESDHTTDTQGEPVQVVQNLSLIPIFEDPLSPSTVLTYLSLPEAEQYFATRFASDAWINASQEDKITALVMATRDIEQLNFIGCQADPKQSLAFPRKTGLLDAPINPPQIKYACCEIAYSYLDGIELEAEINRIIIEDQRFSGVSETYRGVSVNEAKRAGIISNRAWLYLKPYLKDGYALSIK